MKGIHNQELKELAYMTQSILKRLKKIYQFDKISLMPFAYNFYIHPLKDWYLRIIPRFIHRGGFELGTKTLKWFGIMRPIDLDTF